MDFTDRSLGRDFHSGIPPAKRSNNNTMATAAQLQQQQQQQLHGHGRSLTPQKLNMSLHDEDDAHSDGTPINLRGENGLRHHDEDIPDDEEEDDEEEMNIDEDVPLALNRITEHAAALAAVQREREQAQVNHLASLNLSLLERERERCEDADKLKRQQQQQLQLEQLQREQLLHHQQQLQLLERERELELQREREREIEKQQQHEQLHVPEPNRQNGDRLNGGARTDSPHGVVSNESQNRSGSANGSTSPGLGATGTTMGIMGMQFKLTSRGKFIEILILFNENTNYLLFHSTR